mmetsp:Transcript_79417/g.257216  ORF Transcript_79417/g.257216 Transcript_79417/m.257216 type:complete len:295 (-) Transcript_79417:34-918(-)
MASAARSAPHQLVGDLHGELVRELSGELGLHLQGLGHASRLLRTRGLAANSTCKKLLVLDHTFNTMRHITCISAESFRESVLEEVRRRPAAGPLKPDAVLPAEAATSECGTDSADTIEADEQAVASDLALAPPAKVQRTCSSSDNVAHANIPGQTDQIASDQSLGKPDGDTVNMLMGKLELAYKMAADEHAKLTDYQRCLHMLPKSDKASSETQQLQREIWRRTDLINEFEADIHTLEAQVVQLINHSSLPPEAAAPARARFQALRSPLNAPHGLRQHPHAFGSGPRRTAKKRR